MKTPLSVVVAIVAWIVAANPLSSETSQAPKPSFDVISIKPSAPSPAMGGMRGGGARGNRYTMSNATLRMLVQQAYRLPSEGPGQLQIVGAPNWVDSDRFDIQATVDCSGGVLSREQVQLMVQSMMEERFELKAHFETREMPIYNLVVARDGPKLKLSDDQAPLSIAGGGPPLPCAPATATPPTSPPPPPPPPLSGGGNPFPPNFTLPRGTMMMSMNPTGMTVQGAGLPLLNLVSMLQQQVGRPIVDKTDLKGLFDFRLHFSSEGMAMPGPAGVPLGPAPTAPPSADPVPSLFTAIQDLGLKLESAKGPVKVLVIDSVQKPKENQ